MLGAIFISLGSLFQYSRTLSFKQFLLMVLHFALELGQNFDKRFSPDLPNLKTLLVKEKSCFALYTSIRSRDVSGNDVFYCGTNLKEPQYEVSSSKLCKVLYR